jgi:hypothetical protein
MTQGGRGVVVPGCSICKVRLQTVGQFTDHLCEKVLAAVERAVEKSLGSQMVAKGFHNCPKYPNSTE